MLFETEMFVVFLKAVFKKTFANDIMVFFRKYVSKDRILCVTPTSLKSTVAGECKTPALIEKLLSRLCCYDFALIIPRTCLYVCNRWPAVGGRRVKQKRGKKRKPIIRFCHGIRRRRSLREGLTGGGARRINTRGGKQRCKRRFACYYYCFTACIRRKNGSRQCNNVIRGVYVR